MSVELTVTCLLRDGKSIVIEHEHSRAGMSLFDATTEGLLTMAPAIRKLDAILVEVHAKPAD